MQRKDKLSQGQVSRLRKSRWYSDGGGLHLRIDHGGRRNGWAFRWTRRWRAREIDLGGLAPISLAEAREVRDDARGCLDPRCEQEWVEERREFTVALIAKRIKLGPDSGTTHLHPFFDQDDVLFGAGVSKSLTGRLWNCVRPSSWFIQVAIVTIDDYPKRRKAEAAEPEAIVTEEPRFNRSVVIDLTWLKRSDRQTFVEKRAGLVAERAAGAAGAARGVAR